MERGGSNKERHGRVEKQKKKIRQHVFNYFPLLSVSAPASLLIFCCCCCYARPAVFLLVLSLYSFTGVMQMPMRR